MRARTEARQRKCSRTGTRRALALALAVLATSGLAAPPRAAAAAAAGDEPPDPGAPFDQPVTPPPDVRLAASRGVWVGVHAGLFAALGRDRVPGGGAAVLGGWGFGNGLVVEGQTAFWFHDRSVGTDGPYDGTLVVPILFGARYRAVSLWRYRPVLYAAAHLGPVIARAQYLGPTATKAGFGLQAAVGVQIPLAARWLIDCSFGYLLDAGGAPAAGTIMERFGTAHALMLTVGAAFHLPQREPNDPLGLRRLGPPAP
jgi:hypothetical protein